MKSVCITKRKAFTASNGEERLVHVCGFFESLFQCCCKGPSLDEDCVLSVLSWLPETKQK